MYSCYDSYLVFGVIESSRHAMLDRDWLEEHFPDINMFASDVVRNHMGNAVYCVVAQFDKQTGQAYVSNESHAEVIRLYDVLYQYYTGMGDEYLPDVGFFTVISGGYDTSDHSEYIPE